VAETAALSEGGIDKEIGSGELQEQGADDAPDLSGIMIPTGLVLGLLLVVSVGVVAVGCLCYRARQTHKKGELAFYLYGFKRCFRLFKLRGKGYRVLLLSLQYIYLVVC
jgi:hypothetical protein